MTDNKNKTVRLDPETYDVISRMADKNDRTLVGQIRHMAKAFDLMNILAVDVLPRPADANPVPVITVGK